MSSTTLRMIKISLMFASYQIRKVGRCVYFWCCLFKKIRYFGLLSGQLSLLLWYTTCKLFWLIIGRHLIEIQNSCSYIMFIKAGQAESCSKLLKFAFRHLIFLFPELFVFNQVIRTLILSNKCLFQPVQCLASYHKFVLTIY